MYSCGFGEFEEREIGGAWLPHRVRRGDLFVTRSTTPYELRWRSPSGAELDVIHIHLALDQCRTGRNLGSCVINATHTLFG